MRPQTISYIALGALVAALGCGKNLDTMARPDETAVAPDTAQNTAGYKGQERDTAMTAADTASGNQPVTSKGDTLNPGVDSSTADQPAPGATVGVDTSAVPSAVDTSSTTTEIDTTGSSPTDTTAQ